MFQVSDLIAGSGKLALLEKILNKLRYQGHRLTISSSESTMQVSRVSWSVKLTLHALVRFLEPKRNQITIKL